MPENKLILDTENIDRVTRRLVDDLAALVKTPEQLVLIGIRTHGATLAKRMQTIFAETHKWDVPLGTVDITLYRDDLDRLDSQPIVGPTTLEFDVTDRVVALIDDVIYTGRTTRCALAEIMDYGRPLAIHLVALVDRGLREFPIQPDLVGVSVNTSPEQKIEVHLDEKGQPDQVVMYTVDASST